MKRAEIYPFRSEARKGANKRVTFAAMGFNTKLTKISRPIVAVNRNSGGARLRGLGPGKQKGSIMKRPPQFSTDREFINEFGPLVLSELERAKSVVEKKIDRVRDMIRPQLTNKNLDTLVSAIVEKTRNKRKLSAAGRKAIATAQKARWAAKRAEKKPAKK